MLPEEAAPLGGVAGTVGSVSLAVRLSVHGAVYPMLNPEQNSQVRAKRTLRISVMDMRRLLMFVTLSLVPCLYKLLY